MPSLYSRDIPLLSCNAQYFSQRADEQRTTTFQKIHKVHDSLVFHSTRNVEYSKAPQTAGKM